MSGYWQNLESRNFVSGGTVAFSLDGLPPQTRVRSITLTFDLTGTKGTADALSGDLFARIASNIKLANYVNLSGMDLSRLNWEIDGHVTEDPAAYYSVPASGTSFNMYFNLTINFREMRSGASDDFSIPTELLASKSLELTLAAGNVWGVGTLTVTGGAIRCCVERVHETNVPALGRMAYLDASSQTIRLEPGLYKDLIIVKPDGSAITAADVGSVDLVADGRPILQQVRFEQLVNGWNRTAQRNGVSGSRSELLRSGASFLPLVWHDNSGQSRLTKQLLAEKDCTLQITSGSLANPRLVFWRAVAKDQETIVAIARSIGAPENATVYEPAVSSKTPPQAAGQATATGKPPKKVSAMYSYLPGKFRSSPTPGNKLA